MVDIRHQYTVEKRTALDLSANVLLHVTVREIISFGKNCFLHIFFIDLAYDILYMWLENFTYYLVD